MFEAVEAGSPDQQRVRRWSELAYAAMRQRGYEPVPLKEARD